MTHEITDEELERLEKFHNHWISMPQWGTSRGQREDSGTVVGLIKMLREARAERDEALRNEQSSASAYSNARDALEVLKKCLEDLSRSFETIDRGSETIDRGRFGAFVSASARDKAIEALAEIEKIMG